MCINYTIHVQRTYNNYIRKMFHIYLCVLKITNQNTIYWYYVLIVSQDLSNFIVMYDVCKMMMVYMNNT